jgi:plastocyanin
MKNWIAILILIGGFQVALAEDAGSISGKVVFDGSAPAPPTVSVNTDVEVCGEEQVSEQFVVGADNGIKWAVVRLIGANGPAPAPADPPALDQKGCRFIPHVVVMSKGESLDILNNDGIMHNFHSHSKANPSVNKAQPKFRKKMSQEFEQAEFVKVTCDVHNWMSAWVVVSDDAFVAVTDNSGSFTLENVPPGTYKLEVWQELLGTQSQDVTVAAGGTANATFTYSRPGAAN